MGVPERTPAEFIVIPAGNPVGDAKVGVGFPNVFTVSMKNWLGTPGRKDVVVIDGGIGAVAIVMVRVMESCPAVLFAYTL